MSLRVKRSLSVDEVFERVMHYDLVLTVDAPLADALNARLQAPRLGAFATTPRRLAYRVLDEADDPSKDKRSLFLEIIQNTSLS